LFVAKIVVNSWLFRELIKKARRKGYFTKKDIEGVIADVDAGDGSKRYSSSTIGRRSMTIMSWVRLISEELKTFSIDDEKITLK
jgi:hypothetical protein